MNPRPHRPPRGSTLLLAMILLAVLSLVGVAAVTLAMQERSNTGAKARRDMQLACANAARVVVFAELARMGSSYLTSTETPPTFTMPDGTVLAQSHYDTPTGVTVVDITPSRTLPVSSDPAQYGAADLTNAFSTKGIAGTTVPGYEVVARCQDSKGRQLEVEFIVAPSL
jgi:Tfp pilus assembly protein PilX